ncbi:MAG: hypothetical protein AAF801_17905 [Pseudomonadota bacterium]
MSDIDALAKLHSQAQMLGRKLVAEDHGYYLVGPGCADDTRLGTTISEAERVSKRMIARHRKAEALRANHAIKGGRPIRQLRALHSVRCQDLKRQRTE